MDKVPALETPYMHDPVGSGPLNPRTASRMGYHTTLKAIDQKQGGIFHQISKDQWFRSQSCEGGDGNRWVARGHRWWEGALI